MSEVMRLANSILAKCQSTYRPNERAPERLRPQRHEALCRRPPHAGTSTACNAKHQMIHSEKERIFADRTAAGQANVK